MSQPSIFVAVPCPQTGGYRPFDVNLAHFLKQHPEAEVCYGITGVVVGARNRLVREAFKAQDEYVKQGGKAEDHRIWWLDDDQPFAVADFSALLAHNVDAVIPLSLRRGPPFLPLLFDGIDDTYHARQHFMHDHEKGLIPVAGAGFAGLLIRTNCFRTIGADGWFEFVHPPENFDDYCLAVDERIVTADLRWVRSGDLKTGDQLLSFDEEPTKTTGANKKAVRRWKFSDITASKRDAVECLRVTLSDGTSVVCTPEHPWLVDPDGQATNPQQWVRADALMTARRGRWGSPIHGHYVLRALRPWTTDVSKTAGWVAGIFDGEGTVVSDANGTRVSAAQKDGMVQDEIRRALYALGFVSSTVPHVSNGVKTISICGGFDEQARFLGTVRPYRLLADWQTKWRQRACQVLDRVEVVSVESAGVCEIQRISTTAKTYVGEGFLMHNSEDLPFYRKLTASGVQLYCDLETRFGHAVTSVVWPVRQHGAWVTVLATDQPYCAIKQVADPLMQKFGVAPDEFHGLKKRQLVTQ